MRVGQLDKRVAIWYWSTADTSSVEHVRTETYLATVWGKISWDTSGETTRGDKTVSEKSGTVTIRYRSDITSSDWFVYNERKLHIVGIIDPEEKHEWLICSVRE